jgi:hypothetical protein
MTADIHIDIVKIIYQTHQIKKLWKNGSKWKIVQKVPRDTRESRHSNNTLFFPHEDYVGSEKSLPYFLIPEITTLVPLFSVLGLINHVAAP